MRKLHLWAFLLIAVIAFASCTQTQKAEKKQIAEHVIYIGLDGWGSYSVDKADMPNVKALMAEGCWTLQKRAVLPSSSGVNWASMFMGATPELHGYTTWNSATHEIPERVILKNNIFPTMFQLVRDAQPEAEIGCIYEWDGIKYVLDTLSTSYQEMVHPSKIYTDEMKNMSVKYIKEKKPVLGAFIFDNPDHVGHDKGHDTPEYYANLTELDGYVGEIIQATKEAGIYENCIFIVTSDHGGINKGHGGKTLEEINTPFIIAGKGVKKGGEFQESMMQFDCAPTVLHIFGLEGPQVWTGRPMTQVFE
ncbi:MAG: alkaline phosphatase [Bacteroidaceae bacterium]|nr:alkaline phosphatase [Bacteroidaceae bacterium]